MTAVKVTKQIPDRNMGGEKIKFAAGPRFSKSYLSSKKKSAARFTKFTRDKKDFL